MTTGAKNSEEDRLVAEITLRSAMKKLSKAQYDAYLYMEILGFSSAEVARILGGSEQATRKNRSSARVSLKKILQP